MITKITMAGVASYTHPTSLATEKRISLIYGLNGTGKSTISNFLYELSDEKYRSCSVDGYQQEKILVYNTRFVSEHFYEADKLSGIFTLSKENASAAVELNEIQAKIDQLNSEKSSLNGRLNEYENEYAEQKRRLEEEVWSIKREFTGGDRVLEYCLDGQKGSMSKLFEHLQSVSLPESEVEDSIEELKKRVEDLRSSSSDPVSELQLISTDASRIESMPSWGLPIQGNDRSRMAALIEEIQSADWTKQGLLFAMKLAENHRNECPFCQQETITIDVMSELKAYFDDSYQKQIEELRANRHEYVNCLLVAQKYDFLDRRRFFQEDFDAAQTALRKLNELLERNLERIDQKLQSPSTQVVLAPTRIIEDEVNKYVAAANERIASHNQDIANKSASLEKIKLKFWQMMRVKYDRVLIDAEKKKRKETVSR